MDYIDILSHLHDVPLANQSHSRFSSHKHLLDLFLPTTTWNFLNR